MTPYTVTKEDNGCFAVHHGEDDLYFASTLEGAQVMADDLNLHQAAPALLAACEVALRAFSDNMRPGPMDTEAIQALRAALNLARGKGSE